MQSEDYDPDDESKQRIQMSDFSATVEAIQDVGNQVRMLRMEQIGIGTGKTPPTIKPLQGPKTAMDQAAGRLRLKEHLTLSARLLPKKRAEYLAKVDEL